MDLEGLVNVPLDELTVMLSKTDFSSFFFFLNAHAERENTQSEVKTNISPGRSQ